MNFFQAVVSAFKRVGDEGRSSRSEFWYFTLFFYMFHQIYLILSTILNTCGLFELNELDEEDEVDCMPFAILMHEVGAVPIIVVPFFVLMEYTFPVVLFISWILLYVCRLHDINKSGWYVLIGGMLYPFVVKVPELLYEIYERGAVGDVPIISRIVIIVFIVLLIWQIIWLCRKGDA